MRSFQRIQKSWHFFRWIVTYDSVHTITIIQTSFWGCKMMIRAVFSKRMPEYLIIELAYSVKNKYIQLKILNLSDSHTRTGPTRKLGPLLIYIHPTQEVGAASNPDVRRRKKGGGSGQTHIHMCLSTCPRFLHVFWATPFFERVGGLTSYVIFFFLWLHK